MRTRTKLLRGLWRQSTPVVENRPSTQNLDCIQESFETILEDKSLLSSVSSKLLGHDLMELGDEYLFLGALYEIKFQQMLIEPSLLDDFYLAFKLIRSGFLSFTHKLKQTIKKSYKKFNSESYVHFFIEKQLKVRA